MRPTSPITGKNSSAASTRPIDIWGSDHHGYIERLKASIQALGMDRDRLKVILIQFVTLLKDGKPVGMSTRAGQFTTLREVLDEVGVGRGPLLLPHEEERRPPRIRPRPRQEDLEREPRLLRAVRPCPHRVDIQDGGRPGHRYRRCRQRGR